MDGRDVAEVLAKPISQELLASPIPARLAYTGVDGAPRVIPIAFRWNGEQVLLATVPGSAKVRALRRDPRVAITVDTQQQWPPRVLLIRGTVSLADVEGVPESYVEASRKVTPAEHFADWERGVRALYDRMTLITLEPTWAKLLDFETTLPESVENLLREKTGGRGDG